MKNKIDIFHVGPQKSATTWTYNCFKEHTNIYVPVSDAIHYYSMYFHKTYQWYISYYKNAQNNQIICDTSYDYFRSPWAAERIFRDNPNAKIIICIRDPIERAFSHYWHEKKKNRFNFKFEEVFQNFDLYTNWIEPSMYSTHIERFVSWFGWDQIKVVWFDDLQKDPEYFIREIFEFAGVDSSFKPSVLDKRLNVARAPDSFATIMYKRVSSTAKKIGLGPVGKWMKEKTQFNSQSNINQKGVEKLTDVEPGIIQELCAHFEPEISRLENIFGKDLTAWRERYYNV
jgi:hypothetical protein